MNMHPVSVIIPTYNRKQLLPRALNSIFRQSCRCGEIIVVDDGSKDGTDTYLQSLLSQSIVPIKYLQQENKGPAAARNLGIAHATYQYITFLDSDDHWHPRKIEKQFRMMEENRHYLISHTLEKWLRRGKHLNQKKRHIPQHGNIFQQCLELCAVGMSTVMVRKELFARVGTFEPSLRCCEDYDLWLRVSCKYPFLLVDEALTVKEGGREDQVSQHYRVGMDKLRIQAIEHLLERDLLDTRQVEQACKELVKKATIYGNGCVRHGRVEEGERYLRRAASIQEKIAEGIS